MAYPPSFERLGIGQGLANGTVHAVLQDRKGFLWFGTEDGLDRFDGNRFQVFRHEAGRPNSLGGSWITCLLEDRDGLLWIGTMGGGLSRLDPKDLSIRCWRVGSMLHSDHITSLAQDHRGRIWIGSQDQGIFLVEHPSDPSGDIQFRNFRASGDPRSLAPGPIVNIFEDRKGAIWLGSNDTGLCHLIEGSEFSFERYPADFARPETSPPPTLLSIQEDVHGVMWLGSKQGLYRFLPEKRCFQRFANRSHHSDDPGFGLVRQVFLDRDGMIWIATDGRGLYRMLPRLGPEDPPRFVRFRHDENDEHSLASDAVERIFEDRSGVLWISTYATGLNKLLLNAASDGDRERRTLIRLHARAMDASSLSSNTVVAVAEDRFGHLWVGTDGGGLNRMVPPAGTHEIPRFERFRAHPGLPGALQDDAITCLYRDSSRQLWGGSYTGGLIRIDVREGAAPRFTHFRTDPRNPSTISSNFVTSICEDSSHRFWIGTVDGGLNRFDPQKGTFLRYPIAGGLSSPHIYGMALDRFGTLWLGTLDGLNRFNPETGKFKSYAASDRPGRLSHPVVYHLHSDHQGRLWIGTHGGGLNVIEVPPWDGPEPNFIHYGMKEGLPDNNVQAILEDAQGRFWMSTNRSLCRFDPERNQFHAFPWNADLQNTEFVRNAAYRSDVGELFFGGNQGLNVFNPDDVVLNPFVPPLAFTDLQVLNRMVSVGEKVNGRRILTTSIAETRDITLTSRDYVCSFEFAALHFANPAANQYATWMEGLDPGWIPTGNRHFVTYTTLPPGDYVLHVKGANCDGLWNEEGIRLAIHVMPPWWRTWWFLLGAGLATLGLFFLLHHRRTQWLRKQNAELEARVQRRTEALEIANTSLQELDKLKASFTAMLVHDLRSPMTSIHVSLDLLESKGHLDLGILGGCRHSLQHMIAMLNDLLDVFRAEGGEMPLALRPTAPGPMLLAIRNAFGPQCERKQIQLKLDLPEPLPDIVADQVKVERALSNLLGNAIKFTPLGGVILLSAAVVDGSGIETGLRWLTLCVQDSGPGIPPEELPYIFDPYYQASDVGRNQKQKDIKDGNLGVGLGLAVVQRIMAAHRGRVAVRSQLGVGTSFTLFFPL